MICLTGNEREVAAVAARLRDHPRALHEVRLDELAAPAEVFDLLAREAPRLVVACRPERQGGHFSGSESERLALLRRAANAGVRWLDVEADVGASICERERLILSEHHFEGLADPAARLRAMRPRAAIVKLATMVRDAAELHDLLSARRAIDGDAIVIGMGEAGLLSRARAAAFGSRWSYVAASPDTATAPGQLDLASWKHQRLDDQAAPFCALVGGPQVFRSPGPRRYPPFFAARGLPARSYLPVVTTSLERTLPLLEALGAIGLSVTMPLKAEAAALARGDALVRRLGAANSLRRREGWEATNTDVAGVRGPLLPHVSRGQRALVLGAGGAAAASVEALRGLGLEVAISARGAARAEALATRFEGLVVIPWGERGRCRPEVLVNATPLAGSDTPWPDEAPRLPLVLDLAFGENRLRRQCRRYLDATSMWVAQGAAQIGWFFGVDVAPAEICA